MHRRVIFLDGKHVGDMHARVTTRVASGRQPRPARRERPRHRLRNALLLLVCLSRARRSTYHPRSTRCTSPRRLRAARGAVRRRPSAGSPRRGRETNCDARASTRPSPPRTPTLRPSRSPPTDSSISLPRLRSPRARPPPALPRRRARPLSSARRTPESRSKQLATAAAAAAASSAPPSSSATASHAAETPGAPPRSVRSRPPSPPAFRSTLPDDIDAMYHQMQHLGSKWADLHAEAELLEESKKCVRSPPSPCTT